MLLALVGCGLLPSLDTELLISNDGHQPVSVDVTAGSTAVWAGLLQPGEAHRARFSPAQDSSFAVKASHGGPSFEVGGLGYTTPNDGQRLHLHVGPSSAVLDGEAAHARSRVQRLLDDPSVQGFLHLELAANRPLTIEAPAALQQESGQVHAGGQDVVFQQGGRLRLGLDGNDVTVAIPDEGVVGRAVFGRAGEGWGAPTVDLVEQ